MGSNLPMHVGVFLAIIVCAAFPDGGEGRAVVQVASQAITAAVGSSVLLNVSYSLQRPSASHADADVEWSFRRGNSDVRVAEHKQGITNLREYGNRAELFLANGSLLLTSLAKKESGIYMVSITDTADGGKDRKQIYLTVLYPVGTVTVTASPVPTAANPWLPGHNVSLTCSVSSGDEVALTWNRNKEPALAGSSARSIRLSQDNTTLAIDGLQAADAGAYACIASNRVSRKEGTYTVTVGGNGAASLGPTAGAILLLLTCLLTIA